MPQCNLKELNLSKVSDLESLKTLGSYFSLKNSIENTIGFKLGVKGWNNLLDKILTLKVELKNSSYFDNLILKEKLADSKKRIIKKARY